MIDRKARSGAPDLGQWFTPFWSAEVLVEDALRGLGRVSVCEPACGTGAFLAAVPLELPAFGIDIDPLVIPAAIANTGREVILGDFLTMDLADREIELLIGNPSFKSTVVGPFIDRAHEILPDGGMLALILPGYIFQTPSRVTGWMERFSIDVSLIPRTLFPRLSKDLVWAKFRKGATRIHHGLLLYAEQRDIEMMRRSMRHAVEGPGTWREVVRLALESLGGEASLTAIYDRITPERRAGRPHWEAKVRQILQLHFERRDRGRWALAA